MAHPPLISQRSGPLTASPKGEAFSQVQLIPLRLFLVQGDLLGQDTDLAVELAQFDGHKELLGQQQKDDDNIDKVDGLMKPSRFAAQ